jgi:hypothetical protein
MCDERERLIGYVYEECDAEDRRAIDRHLASCEDCQDEIAGLRRARQDLLAWDVPAHDSVWRPFAPAQTTPWWRQVPAWAMAAAAGVMFAFGVAGGAVAHAFLGEPPATMPVEIAADARDNRTDRVVRTRLVSPADLSASEQRILTRLRDDLARVDRRVRLVSGQAGGLGETVVQTTAETSELATRLDQLIQLQQQLNTHINNQITELAGRTNRLDSATKTNSAQLSFLLTQTGAAGGGGR